MAGKVAKSVAEAAPAESLEVAVRRGVGAIARHADRGTLFGYAAQAPVEKGAYTWHGIELSEANAIRAVAERSMVVQAPNGAPIRLDYVRHQVHANGNWTFVGRPAGARPGQEAVLTFGEKAVFGTIPNGDGPNLEVTTLAGRTYLIEADPTQVKEVVHSDVDALTGTMLASFENSSAESGAPARVVSADRMHAAGATAENAVATASNTIDLVLGYTATFANRLGGDAQAVTRLENMVQTTNTALANSLVNGQVRLVETVRVEYGDTNTNRAALFELTGVSCTNATGGQLPDGGVSCTPATRPAALAPLAEAREEFGADLVALVRTFQAPEQGGCGTGWLNGNGQSEINAEDAAFGFSVVSDSGGNAFPDPEGGTCRNDNLAHELGHNLGLAHDREIAARSTDSDGDGNLLDPAEFGRFPYAFGYVAAADAGNFYDVMAPRRNGLASALLYSNPQVSVSGFPAGNATTADAARALRQTIPMVAAFRANVLPLPSGQRNDFNGETLSDILWRNNSTGQTQIWLGANSQTQQAMPLAGSAWRIATTADFNGDGSSDILWRNVNTGQNTIWLSGNSATQQAVTFVGNQAWAVVGAGDFDGDGSADILWRNGTTGQNLIWRSGNSATQTPVNTVGNLAWRVAGVGDFDADGRADILWRNGQTGQNLVWSGGTSANQHVLVTTSLAWSVAGVNDFDGDGAADILWRNANTGQNLIWGAASNLNQQAVAPVGNPTWRVAATGDYDGDGQGDILWRNTSSGQNLIWHSANSGRQTVLPLVGNQAWVISG